MQCSYINNCIYGNVCQITQTDTPCGEVKSTPFLQTLPKPSIDGGKKSQNSTEINALSPSKCSRADPLYSHLFFATEGGEDITQHSVYSVYQISGKIDYMVKFAVLSFLMWSYTKK